MRIYCQRQRCSPRSLVYYGLWRYKTYADLCRGSLVKCLSKLACPPLHAVTVLLKDELPRILTCCWHFCNFKYKMLIIASSATLLYQFSILFVIISRRYSCKCEQFNKKTLRNGFH